MRELRGLMSEFGLAETPIFMAGGVWYLREWADWIDNPELGPVAFQFGTRPLLTRESPISDAWKARLLTLREGDVYLNRFSPTGFYSSAVRNGFLKELQQRSEHQVAYAVEPVGEHVAPFHVGARGRLVYLTPHDRESAQRWVAEGFTEALRTPDSTLIFVTPEKALEIRTDQINCMGCLSACQFSNWAQNEQGYDRQEGRPAQLLHPEDVAGDPPLRRCRIPADVRRTQRLPLRRATRSMRTAMCRPSRSWSSACKPAIDRGIRRMRAALFPETARLYHGHGIAADLPQCSWSVCARRACARRGSASLSRACCLTAAIGM